MPRLDQEDVSKSPLRCLFYGPIGAGKTFLCGSALKVEEMCPVFFGDVDGGSESCRDVFLSHWDQVEVWKIASYDDVGALATALFSAKSPFKTVVLDGLTEFHALLMREHLAKEGRVDSPPFLQDYGAVSKTMLDFLREIKDTSNVHFLTTAGEGIDKDEISGAMHITPDIVGKLSFRAPRFFHIVGYLTVVLPRSHKDQIPKPGMRRLQLQPVNRIRAKDRTPGQPLGNALENPTMRIIYDAVYYGKRVAPGSDASTEEHQRNIKETKDASN